jgi:hypothetical protein
LPRRLEALDLDQGEVAHVERATFRDLQRVYSMCDCKKRCDPRPCARSRRPGLEELLPECADADGFERVALDGAAGMVIYKRTWGGRAKLGAGPRRRLSVGHLQNEEREVRPKQRTYNCPQTAKKFHGKAP